MERLVNHGRVVALTPGRMRIRLHRPHRQMIPQVKTFLESKRGIGQVITNPLTGSVLVRFDFRRLSCDDVLALCHDVGVVVSNVLEAEEEPLTEVIKGRATDGIIGAFNDLDRRLSRIIGQEVDLRMLVPLLLGALGVHQLAVNGLGSASGYLLLLLAANSALRVHRERRRLKVQAPLQLTAPSTA
jgi:hypothetical protein